MPTTWSADIEMQDMSGRLIGKSSHMGAGDADGAMTRGTQQQQTRALSACARILRAQGNLQEIDNWLQQHAVMQKLDKQGQRAVESVDAVHRALRECTQNKEDPNAVLTLHRAMAGLILAAKTTTPIPNILGMEGPSMLSDAVNVSWDWAEALSIPNWCANGHTPEAVATVQTAANQIQELSETLKLDRIALPLRDLDANLQILCRFLGHVTEDTDASLSELYTAYCYVFNHHIYTHRLTRRIEIQKQITQLNNHLVDAQNALAVAYPLIAQHKAAQSDLIRAQANAYEAQQCLLTRIGLDSMEPRDFIESGPTGFEDWVRNLKMGGPLVLQQDKQYWRNRVEDGLKSTNMHALLNTWYNAIISMDAASKKICSNAALFEQTTSPTAREAICIVRQVAQAGDGHPKKGFGDVVNPDVAS